MNRVHRSLRRAAAAVAVPLLLAACLDGGTEPIELVANTCNFAFAFDTTKMTKTSTGLFYQDLTAGTGTQVAAGDDVAVFYSGWLTNGTLFDAATPTTSNPFAFPLGANAVIRGFDEGITGMKVGGCRLLVIPPSLGYGSTANGPIPANSTLVFQVGLVGVR